MASAGALLEAYGNDNRGAALGVQDLGTLDVLIADLERATAGSRDLDLRLHYAVSVLATANLDLARIMIEEGIAWETVSVALEERVAAHTTSVDASIAGENIFVVLRSPKRGQWGAMHRTRRGEEIFAWAANEPLARRVAALKGLRAEAARRAPAPVPVRRTVAPSRPRPLEPERAAAGDWKIEF
jgi:hypothetical protein